MRRQQSNRIAVCLCVLGTLAWLSSPISAQGGARLPSMSAQTGPVSNVIDTYCFHRNFFPLGYALENFDPLGRWRTHDQVGPVDASGAFVDGTSTNGVVELRQVLLQHPEAFRTTIAETLLIYLSTGSVAPTSGTPDTLIRARGILRSAPKPRWSALIAAIVQAKSVAGE